MKADLHIHSHHSNDSCSSVAEILQQAKERGLECIAISDHNTLGAYDDIPDDPGVIIIPAVEVSSAAGHILAYGVTVDIERDMSVRETIDAIHAAGGLACVAHPYRMRSGIGGENVSNDFDLVEGWNSRSSRKGNRQAMSLARSLGLPMTAGSDSHRPDTVGDAFVEITVPCRDHDDVLQAIMDGKTELGGKHRGAFATLRYAVKTVGEWILRGCRRM
ncbi:MAG: CehA/McbA family metallohydrolase [Candidatus Methanomethylophilaceae archaeon]